jgi:hypothetical protein
MTKADFPGNKSVALLLDPDKVTEQGLKKLLGIAAECKID